MIIAVDPGRCTGWAIGTEDGVLLRMGAGKPESVPTGIRYSHLVIEKPHGGKGNASRKNLVVLARRMQTVIMIVSADVIEEVLPNRWKGQTDGDIMTRRIRDRWMNDHDRAILAGSNDHNRIDAYGLLRWWWAKEGIRPIE